MVVKKDRFSDCFAQDKLDTLWPADRADLFFEALLGDAREGAYDIRLTYQGHESNRIRFHIELHQRPGRCLACNLTYGLPTVFARHPVIDLNGLVTGINHLLNGQGRCHQWKLEATEEISRHLHVVPLFIELDQSP